MRHDRVPQAVALVTYLSKNPESTSDEIKAALDLPSHLHHVISFVRNQWGDEVLICRYSKEKRGWVYSLGNNAAEGRMYVVDRKKKVRNETANLVGICDRVDARWPGDPHMRIVRAMLNSVVEILDAAS